MAIGKNSRMSSVRSSIRAPKFLDKSSGFYGRLDEPETPSEGREVEENVVEVGRRVEVTVVHGREEAEDFTEGMMEDDGETLLERKPSRLSSRWRRSSRRKQKAEEEQARDERSSLEDVVEAGVQLEVELEKLKEMQEENGKEATLVHFPVREEADDQVLIRDKKRGREEEGEEERKIRREQEEGMKVVKRKNYRKIIQLNKPRLVSA